MPPGTMMAIQSARGVGSGVHGGTLVPLPCESRDGGDLRVDE